MKVFGHRAIRGASVHRDGPVDRLVLSERPGEGARVHAALGDRAGDDERLGPLVAHVALSLRRACGRDATWSKVWQDEDDDWIILTEALDEHEAHAAARAAVAIARAALDGEDVDRAFDDGVVAVHEALASNSTARMLERAAMKRGIPVTVLGPDHLQLGWGVRRRTFWGSMSDATSGLGHEIANDHERSKDVLQERGIPLPDYEAVRTLRGTMEVAHELRYPIAIKPLRGPGGVTPYIDEDGEVEAAYDRAKAHHRWVVVEDHVRGTPHRLLVHQGDVVAAVRDGEEGPEDVLQTLHPAVRLVASRAARIACIDLVAIHVVADRLDVPLDESRGKVVGMEPCPDLAAFPGGDRVADALVATIDGDGRIPLVAVTGTNGKTTTVRLISHILKFSGGRVGMACTGAVEVENQVILRGDYSGPAAARAVLREPGVTHAVCEVARGGLLKRGLGFDRCDVAVFLNVGSDHLGEGGIDSVEDLATLKGVVARSAKQGTVVANADDPHVWSQRNDWTAVIPFSLDPAHPDLAAHLAADPDHVAVTLEDNVVVLKRGTATFQVCSILDIPITLHGAAMFNVQNAMAAVAASYALGISEEDARAALRSFNPTTGQLPGRMNLITLGGVKVLLDYGHNVPALEALAKTLPRLGTGRRINVANASGNRRDEDLRAFGAAIAGMYDRIFLCDPDPRRRTQGATAAIIQDGIASSGFDMGALTLELDEGRALRMALAESRPGDLVVLQADNVEAAIGLLNELRGRLEAGESPAQLNEELLA